MSAANVRQEILIAIGKTNDENMKMVLLLLLSIMDEIGGKIDTILMDEKRLTDVVLNGHAPVHHDHHEWVANKMKEEEEDAKSNKQSGRNIRDGLVKDLLWAVLVVAVGAAGILIK